RTIRMSKKLQPAARTSTPSTPGPTSGSGTSRGTSSRGSIHRSTTIARMRYPNTYEPPTGRDHRTRERRDAAPVRERARQGLGDVARTRRVVGPSSPRARLSPRDPRGHGHRRRPCGRVVGELPGASRPARLCAARRDRAGGQPERGAIQGAPGRAEGSGSVVAIRREIRQPTIRRGEPTAARAELTPATCSTGLHHKAVRARVTRRLEAFGSPAGSKSAHRGGPPCGGPANEVPTGPMFSELVLPSGSVATPPACVSCRGPGPPGAMADRWAPDRVSP